MRITLAKESHFNSRRLANHLSDLVMQNHRSFIFYKGARPSLKFLKKYHRACIENAMKKGICESYYESKKLVGMLVIGEIALAPGLPIYWGFIETDRSKKGDTWVLRKLEEHRVFFKHESMFDVPVYLRHLLPRFYRLGYFIDTVRTLGDPKTAHRRLMKMRKPAVEDFTRLGFEIVKIKTSAELKQVKEIERREFKRNPQFGWFVASEAWLNQALKRRENDLKNSDSCLYAIKRKSKVLGYFGASPQPSYLKGKCVGTDFSFDRSIQGKGFSTLGYRFLLEHMLATDVKFFVGNTAQKPTLKLAQILGRTPQSYSMRFGKSPFNEKHFQY